jgi:hypothetical protein
MDIENKHGFGSLQITENMLIANGANLFAPVVQEESLVDGTTTTYRPLNLSNEGPIEFNIKPMGMKYVHLSACRLFAQLKIVMPNGDDIPAREEVAFVNLPLSSMFKTIDIEVGGRIQPLLGNTHSNYKAYFETVLSYSGSARSSHLRASMLLMDTATRFENYGAENLGYEARKTLTSESRSLQVEGPVHSDFLNIDKFLPPGVEITVRFHRAPDAFALMSNVANAAYKIIIEDIKLRVRFVTLADSIVNQHMKRFETENAIFPINRTELKSSAHPLGLRNLTIPNLFTGVLPKHIIITLIRSTNFNGTYPTNPYLFPHLNCNYATLSVNGEILPSDPYRPNFGLGLFTREYRDFFDNVGISHDDLGNVMTPELYSGGMFMLAFDLTPDRCNGFHSHAKKSGVINLELGFSADTPYPFQVLAFATYDNIVSLDKDNNISIE